MAVIKTPNKEYTGLSAGVLFEKGVGETDKPHLLAWFREHGYEVEEVPEKHHASAEVAWLQVEEQKSWEPEDKPKPKRQARKRGGK